jgi:aminopeptidase N
VRQLLTIFVLVSTVSGARAQVSVTSPFAGHTYRPGVDVVNYDISLDVPDTGRLLRAHTELTVRHLPSVNDLTLDLVRLGVDSVIVGGENRPFQRTDTTLTVSLTAAPETHVTVWYGGPVADGLIVRLDSLGRWTAFGDNWPNRGRYWIPSVDHPSDKATVTWRVRARTGRTVVANGTMEGTSVGADGYTTTLYREHSPIPVYLMVVAVAPLTMTPLGDTACGLSAVGRCVPQMVYTTPELAASAQAFEHAGAIVGFFSQIVAPFPYEKLAHLQSSTRFGGMENASAIFYAEKPYVERKMGEGVVRHETAHQWFGDAVTEREWPHVWLSEGFASYFAALWTEHARGRDSFRQQMASIRRVIMRDTVSVPRRPVIDTIETNLVALLNRNSYEKGAFVLHMLRRQVGDSAFFRGLRSYYTAHLNGTALTGDLQQAVESSSGTSLGWFFDQWLRRPGYAELRTSWQRDARGVIRVTVDQSKRFGAYRFPLDVEISDSSGKIVRTSIDVPARAHVELELPGRFGVAPRQVVFDPDVSLLATFATEGGPQ